MAKGKFNIDLSISKQIYVVKGNAVNNNFNEEQNNESVNLNDENEQKNVRVVFVPYSEETEEIKAGQLGTYYNISSLSNLIWKNIKSIVGNNATITAHQDNTGQRISINTEIELWDLFKRKSLDQKLVKKYFDKSGARYIHKDDIKEVIESLDFEPEIISDKSEDIKISVTPDAVLNIEVKKDNSKTTSKKGQQKTSSSAFDIPLGPIARKAEDEPDIIGQKAFEEINKRNLEAIKGQRKSASIEQEDEKEKIDERTNTTQSLNEKLQSIIIKTLQPLIKYMQPSQNQKQETYSNVKREKNKKSHKNNIAIIIVAAGSVLTIYQASKQINTIIATGKVKTNPDIDNPIDITNLGENPEGTDETRIIVEPTEEELYENIFIGGNYYIESASLSETSTSTSIGEISPTSELSPSGKYAINKVAFVEIDENGSVIQDQIPISIGTEELGSSIKDLMKKNHIDSSKYEVMVHFVDISSNLNDKDESKGWAEASKEVFQDLTQSLTKETITYNGGRQL